MKRLTTILLTFVLALSAAVGGMTYAAAAEAEREFDASPVLYDLKGSTTASGETFDLTDYPYDTDGKRGSWPSWNTATVTRQIREITMRCTCTYTIPREQRSTAPPR